MISLMVLEIFLQAAVLCTILYAVAKYEADYSFQKVAMVAAGIALGNMLIQALLHEHLPVKLRPFLVIPCIAFTAFMIMTFCWINVWKSLLVVVVFVGFQLLGHLGIEVLKKRYGPSEEHAEAVKKKQEEVAETQQAIMDMMEEQAKQMARSVPPPAPAAAASPAVAKVKAPKPVPAAKPVAENQAGDEKEWLEVRKKLRVTGISSSGGKQVALVNNGMVAENDVVRIRHNDRIYSWRAVAVTRDGVEWKRLRASPVKKSVRRKPQR